MTDGRSETLYNILREKIESQYHVIMNALGYVMTKIKNP